MEEINNRGIIWLYEHRITKKRVFSKKFMTEGFDIREWDLIGEIDTYKNLSKSELYFYGRN